MPLSAGTKLGPYLVTAQIGAGGMGEVYRARDTRLNRDVALKVIPEVLAADSDRMARFEREAKLLASLNHPHIAAIYGLEVSGSNDALVMELVEGQTLADRIAAGAIPLDEALPIAKQIAEALEYAHEQGVIHRDLKPANIKVKPDGTVKVLDFGLAKALLDDPAEADIRNSPTLSMAATMAGTILGTVAYMSPEQAKGKPADRRADIWAFGVVLFEMLTGKQLFAGETAAETLASVIKEEPPFERLPTDTPPAIRHLLRRCLEKNVKRRLQHIGEARIVIEDVLSGYAPAEPAAVSKRERPLGWIAAAILLIAFTSLSFIHFRETRPVPRVARFEIPLPGKAVVPIFQLSPDGKVLAFTAFTNGRSQLWLRPIDSLAAQAVPGTEDATYPFWSPDSAYIGFFVPGKLKKVALAGGPAQTICDAPEGRGGTWNSDGIIVFSPGVGSAIERVSEDGGMPAPLTKITSTTELHRYPAFLPDNKHFLFLITYGKPETNGINVGSLDGTAPVRILSDESSAAYAPSQTPSGNGFLLFRREGTLMGVPFDASRVRTAGEVFPIAEVGIGRNTNAAEFSISGSGMLAYTGGGSNDASLIHDAVWMDRTGKRLGDVVLPGRTSGLKLSPDEKRILFTIFNAAGDASDVWLLDVARGVPSRFTFRPGVSADEIWSPDGSSIAFESDLTAIYRKAASGTGKEDLLLGGGINFRPTDWSPDGKYIAFNSSTSGAAGYHVWLLPLEGDHKAVPYLQTPFNTGDAQFSPDGRWMAYASNESGQPQVYVQAIPASGAKWQISPAGGSQPRWRRDGKELFYISTDRKLMAVQVKSAATFEAGSPQSLFELDPLFTLMTGRFAYQPTNDGQRFLVLTNSAGVTTPPITIVLNWQAGLKK